VSITSARAEIRAARKLQGTGPWTIRATDGTSRRFIEWDEGRQELICTCPAGESRRYCWHRTRVQEWLQAKFGNAIPPAKPEAAPEPEAGSWRAAFEEFQNHQQRSTPHA